MALVQGSPAERRAASRHHGGGRGREVWKSRGGRPGQLVFVISVLVDIEIIRLRLRWRWGRRVEDVGVASDARDAVQRAALGDGGAQTSLVRVHGGVASLQRTDGGNRESVGFYIERFEKRMFRGSRNVKVHRMTRRLFGIAARGKIQGKRRVDDGGIFLARRVRCWGS